MLIFKEIHWWYTDSLLKHAHKPTIIIEQFCKLDFTQQEYQYLIKYCIYYGSPPSLQRPYRLSDKVHCACGLCIRRVYVTVKTKLLMIWSHRHLQSCLGARARLGYAAFNARLWKAYFVTTRYVCACVSTRMLYRGSAWAHATCRRVRFSWWVGMIRNTMQCPGMSGLQAPRFDHQHAWHSYP